MDNLQLTELAKQAQSGDMQAFEKLYIELSPEIYSIAYEITQNKEESRDLMQDCFVSAMENINNLKETEKIKNWLIRIAANKSHDYIKKKKPSIFTEEQYCMIENLEEVDSEVIPEKSLDAQERAEEVNEMLQSLSEDKRLCLLLRYKHNMSYAEIAQELGITESAVKSRISRAKDDVEEEAKRREKKGLPLFGVAPFGLVIFALRKSADATAATFAGSSAQTAAFAGISAASQAGVAASSAAVTATTAASASTATATTAAATGTGIAAKVAALSVAQKVIAGVSVAAVVTGSGVGVATVVKSNSEKDITTTTFIEEVTTAPSFEEDFILPIIADTSEFFENSSYAETDSLSSAANGTTSKRTSTPVSNSESQAAANGTTAKNSAATTKKQTTTKAQTTTKKQTTTKSATTTKSSTTAKSTTTTKSQTTTKAATATTTTTKAVTTTTTKATTTTTEASSPATVTVTVWGEETSTTKTLYFEAGETITATEIENRLSDEYGIEAIADDINITAEAGGSYTATAYE